VLIVIDEAHNVCPQRSAGGVVELAARHVIQIAGEGRKFGLYLLTATQRPQKVHENVVSQCDNLLAMRMNSAADLVHLGASFSSLPAALLEEASHFRLGEALVAGKISPVPTHVRFGSRLGQEGGSDVAADWAARAAEPARPDVDESAV
jgi:DNA helicase HerA-like ATPase